MPSVSVVISTFDRVGMLREALGSALAQRDVELEVVVVDNGSTDGTAAYLASVSDPRLRVIRNPVSLGPTGGRNTGLASATRPWVAFLDDDDLWAPDKLRRQLDEVERSGAGWAYTGCVYIDGRRRVLGGQPPLPPDDVARLLPSLYVIPAGLSSMLFRRDLVDGDGLLDERLRWQTDWDLSLRLLRTGPPAWVSAPLVAYRQHAGQVSQGASRYEPELALMEDKFADLRAGAMTFDRGVQHRFVASEALRGGQRRLALRSYREGVRAGDTGSLFRALAVVLPRAMHPWLRRTLLSNRRWIAQARRWLDVLEAPDRHVLFVQRTLRRYREVFFERLRDELRESGVTVDVVHASGALGGSRRDRGELPWATELHARTLDVAGRGLVWLPVWGLARDADLLVSEQASRLVLNYVLALRRIVGLRPAFALWGHGANRDVATASRTGETLKRWVSRRADWWFAYTRGSADIVSRLGYSADRITVFQNATDTTALRQASSEIGPEEVRAARTELGVEGDSACLFLGNFAAEKRLDLLVEAGDRIVREVPGFELVMVGSGDLEAQLEDWARDRPWLHVVGQRFGSELARVAATCRLLLVPGWAGLSVVDSFALGLPMVISSGLPHPPETEYLESGVNGVVSDDGGTADGYAHTVVSLLRSPDRIGTLAEGARESSVVYSIEAMVARVAGGILAALAATGRPARGGDPRTTS